MISDTQLTVEKNEETVKKRKHAKPAKNEPEDEEAPEEEQETDDETAEATNNSEKRKAKSKNIFLNGIILQ